MWVGRFTDLVSRCQSVRYMMSYVLTKPVLDFTTSILKDSVCLSSRVDLWSAEWVERCDIDQSGLRIKFPKLLIEYL